ncbi:UNVERIFIED_CONTAM: hypothetical protein BJ099_101259 [Lysinibacillus xylanilyticus]
MSLLKSVMNTLDFVYEREHLFINSASETMMKNI